MIERLVIGPLSGERFHVMRHLPFGEGSAIHHGHDGIHRHTALDGRPLEGLHQGLRQGKARGLDEDMLHLRLAAQNLFDGGLEIIRHRTADAAIGQFDDVFFRAAFNTAAFQNFAIDTDLAEFIDDDRQPLAVKLFEKTAQQRGFAGPQKTGNDGAGNAVQKGAHDLSSVKSNGGMRATMPRFNGSGRPRQGIRPSGAAASSRAPVNKSSASPVVSPPNT
ncbi:hypothetical protein D3C86_1373720 [compost metagenome]